MEFIIIEKNDKEIIRSRITGSSLLKWLNYYNHLDLFIDKSDNIKINFNNDIFYLNFNELYEIYEFDLRTLYTTTFESKEYFFFIDIVKYYKLHFIKSVYIIKKTNFL